MTFVEWVWEILYKIGIFCGDRTTNMTSLSIVRVCGCQLNKKLSVKSFGQINRYLAGSTYGMFCIKFPQNKMTG